MINVKGKNVKTVMKIVMQRYAMKKTVLVFIFIDKTFFLFFKNITAGIGLLDCHLDHHQNRFCSLRRSDPQQKI